MQPLANPTQSAQARLGSVLSGKWRLDRVLGVGGVAVVYLATHRNRSRAALKLLHAEQAQNPTVRERFVHEGYAANSIDHPGVVKVLDDDVSEDGLPYLVMELLEGETLEERAYRLGDRLPPGEVLALADQLLDVLAVAHEAKVIHRDLKPDNLFLTKSGRLKVLDFGIARLLQAFTSRDVTAVGTLLGTPAFMPPEQARSRWEEVDATSDLYSVGATMFNLLTSRLVREGETLTEQLALAIHEPAPALASVDATQHPAMCELVDRALSYKQADRFPNARAMQIEVRRVRKLVPPPATSSVSPAPESGPLVRPVPGSTPLLPDHELPTLLESGRQRDTVQPIERNSPATNAIGRRLAAFLLLLLALAGALTMVAWLTPRKDVEQPATAQAKLTASAPSVAATGLEATAPKTLPVGSQAPATSPVPDSSASARTTTPTGKGLPGAPRATLHPSAPSANPPVGPPPSPPAPAAVDDPFSKRY